MIPSGAVTSWIPSYYGSTGTTPPISFLLFEIVSGFVWMTFSPALRFRKEVSRGEMSSVSLF